MVIGSGAGHRELPSKAALPPKPPAPHSTTLTRTRKRGASFWRSCSRGRYGVPARSFSALRSLLIAAKSLFAACSTWPGVTRTSLKEGLEEPLRMW